MFKNKFFLSTTCKKKYDNNNFKKKTKKFLFSFQFSADFFSTHWRWTLQLECHHCFRHHTPLWSTFHLLLDRMDWCRLVLPKIHPFFMNLQPILFFRKTHQFYHQPLTIFHLIFHRAQTLHIADPNHISLQTPSQLPRATRWLAKLFQSIRMMTMLVLRQTTASMTQTLFRLSHSHLSMHLDQNKDTLAIHVPGPSRCSCWMWRALISSLNPRVFHQSTPPT